MQRGQQHASLSDNTHWLPEQATPPYVLLFVSRPRGHSSSYGTGDASWFFLFFCLLILLHFCCSCCLLNLIDPTWLFFWLVFLHFDSPWLGFESRRIKMIHSIPLGSVLTHFDSSRLSLTLFDSFWFLLILFFTPWFFFILLDSFFYSLIPLDSPWFCFLMNLIPLDSFFYSLWYLLILFCLILMPLDFPCLFFIHFDSSWFFSTHSYSSWFFFLLI